MMVFEISKPSVRRIALMMVGVALVGNHAIQLFRVTIAVLGGMLRPANAPVLGPEGIGGWAIYYGSVSGILESVLLIVLGAMLFRGSRSARKVLPILLPAIVLHDVCYSTSIGMSLVDVAVLLLIDTCAWLVLLAIPWRDEDRDRAV